LLGLEARLETSTEQPCFRPDVPDLHVDPVDILGMAIAGSLYAGSARPL
jgi:hypothetical protein